MNAEEQEFHLRLAREDFARTQYGLPRDQLLRQVEQIMPEMSPEDQEELVDHITVQQQEDPLALLQDDLFGSGGQMTISNMAPNYEMSLFLAQATGSIILTSSQTRWEEIQHAAKGVDKWWCNELCDLINDFHYPLTTNTNMIIGMRGSSYSGSFKKALRDIGSRIRFNNAPSDKRGVENMAAALSSGLSAIHKKFHSSDVFILDGKLRFQAPSDGFVDNNVQRLLLKSGSSHHLGAASIAILLELQEPVVPA